MEKGKILPKKANSAKRNIYIVETYEELQNANIVLVALPLDVPDERISGEIREVCFPFTSENVRPLKSSWLLCRQLCKQV